MESRDRRKAESRVNINAKRKTESAKMISKLPILTKRSAGPLICPFVKALSDEDKSVRRAAAHSAGHFFTENEVKYLYQAIKEDGGELGKARFIARDAISSLGIIGGEKASLTLNKIWNDNELSKGCKEVTINALGMSGDTNNFKLLESVLKGEDETIRDNAVYGMGRLAYKNRENTGFVKDVKTLLVNHLSDVDIKVRYKVVDSLALICNSEDVPLFESLLNDDYSRIVNYTEDGELKEKVVYPIREKATEAIAKIAAQNTTTN